MEEPVFVIPGVLLLMVLVLGPAAAGAVLAWMFLEHLGWNGWLGGIVSVITFVAIALLAVLILRIIPPIVWFIGGAGATGGPFSFRHLSKSRFWLSQSHASWA